MNRKRIVQLVFVLFISFCIYRWWNSRPVTHGAGVIAPNAPIQENASSIEPFAYKKFRITPLARFTVEARVLNKKRYHFGRSASLAPFDFALGWGRMSDEDVLKSISIRQSDRFYFWFTERYPIPRKEIIVVSANMHLIPADKKILKKFKKVRQGERIRFNGYLVRATASDGWYWNSSLSRSDSGDGACELVWVEEFEIENTKTGH